MPLQGIELRSTIQRSLHTKKNLEEVAAACSQKETIFIMALVDFLDQNTVAAALTLPGAMASLLMSTPLKSSRLSKKISMKHGSSGELLLTMRVTKLRYGSIDMLVRTFVQAVHQSRRVPIDHRLQMTLVVWATLRTAKRAAAVELPDHRIVASCMGLTMGRLNCLVGSTL